MKIKYIKTKKLISVITVAMVSIITLNSCDQLDLAEDPTKSQLAVTPYKSVDEMNLGVTGMYARFRAAAMMSTFYVNGWSGDDITTHRASNKADFREYDQRALTPFNTRTLDTWRNVYGLVRAANTVFENTQMTNFPVADQGKVNVLLGETYFLRGIMFHHLVRIHGKIVIKLTSALDDNPVLSPTIDVYKQIEKDLLKAEELLPIKTDVGSARPNKGSARAMLARLYLDWAGFPVKDAAKNTDAATSAKTVIDNAASYNFDLVSDLDNLWSVAGRQSKESIFTVEFCQPCGLQNQKFGMLGIPGDLKGWGETFAEIRFYEDMPAGYRKNATYYETLPITKDGVPAATAASTVATWSWRESTDQQNPVFKKVVGPLAELGGVNFNTSRNDYFMRMAEVHLIYAEASGASGNVTTAAWESLNKVRRRAAGLPINTAVTTAKPQKVFNSSTGLMEDHSTLTYVDVTSGNIADLAFEERKWEFAGEYVRWPDLVRREKVKDALGGSARDPRSTIGTVYDKNGLKIPTPITKEYNAIKGSLETSSYFAPIPQTEVDYHPSLK